MRKRVAAWVLIGLILLWVCAFLVIKSIHDSTTADMVAVADRLKVPETWPMVSEVVESEKLICLNANPCPSMSRTWQAETELEVDDLHELALSAGWILEIEGDCLRQAGDIGTRSVCSGTVEDRGYEIQLRVDSPEAGAASRLWIHLEEQEPPET
ncbi:hypothetical protein GC088_04505 [Arthrobacter sp. JZ12]|uniref:hypothetical protein n=1 Tax=Arthrobacter sp. JZ12 TaxID=2654190 RepID=UPI002B4991EA|nr:hypothetical protein [Arthrobacter sp. JZ12]WRH24419.1 hypothetical protein GC088_04505 [Arthrobacter sp. JZ12]